LREAVEFIRNDMAENPNLYICEEGTNKLKEFCIDRLVKEKGMDRNYANKIIPRIKKRLEKKGFKFKK
jgi:hypothetical protein